jgi:D-alanine-D-alanine ligase
MKEPVNRKPLKVGLTYDLRSEYPPHEDAPPDYYAEFDTEETVDYIEAALSSLGHRVHRIGNIQKLARFLVFGETVDIVFNIAEGVWGRSREAQVPALLEAFRIPYTFSDPLTMALCLDKAMTKRIWQQAGLPTSAFWVVTNLAELEQAAEHGLEFPLFVKPVHEGSSKGISQDSIVETEQQLVEQVERVLTHYQQPALVEELFLSGREFTVGILGSGREARVLGVLEITEVALYRVSGFLQKEKWELYAPDTYHPLKAGPLQVQLSELGLQAYQAVDCRDTGRLDIRLDRYGNPQLMEINPLPGLHPHHCALPVIGKHAGLSFEMLLAEIIRHATQRWSLVSSCSSQRRN